MIPSSGFYGVFDSRIRLSENELVAAGLPRPSSISADRWGGVWSGGTLSAEIGNDGECWLIFLGALYNRRDLIRQLDLPRDISISSLLLNAWARWPDDWTNRLDGLYALAYWTANGHDLTLRRDSSGTMGLFHARTSSGGIAFASHLGTLVCLPGVNRRLSRQGLHEYLRMLDIAPPNTIYEGVLAVPAGEAMILDVTRPGVEASLPPPAFPRIEVPFDEAVTELDSRLSASIGRRLDGVKRPSALLSGGVDSSLICALAAIHRPDLQTVTVGFEGASYDETPIAQAVAGHLKLPHQVLRFGRDDFLGALIKVGQHVEQPMADPAEPATLLAYERIQENHDVVLDGTGADELAGAMPPRHVRIAVDYSARLPASVRSWLSRNLPLMPGLAGYAPLFDFEHPAETMMRWQGFRRQEIESLCGEPVDLTQIRFMQVFEHFRQADHYSRYSALVEALPSDRLSQSALISGLDVRYPFWDPGVEAWLRGQPQAYRWRPDDPKHMLRALLARHVPRNLWDVPKHSFDFPLLDFLSAEDYQLVRRYLQHGDWAKWQVLSPELVAEYGRRFIAGEHSLRFRVWALVVLAAWLEGHGY